MAKQYQVIQADNTEEMERRIRAMEAQGYVPVGSIICGTRQETVEHNIKGATTVHQTYLKQSFWYAPNVDSAFDCLVKQHNLLTQVVENAAEPSADDGYGNRFCEVDADIVEVIEEHLRGDCQ